MKKHILKVVKPLTFLLVFGTLLIGCDDDYLRIESDISGTQNFSTNKKDFPFLSYTKKSNPVQTNGLPSNLLGVYKDPNYGSTTASIITQILPTDLTPDFGDTPQVESVKLYIPFFSEVESTDDAGNSTYTIDSTYGNASAPYKLSIYRSNYLLRDLDPATDFEEEQAYYSNIFDNIDIDTQTLELLYENDQFTPNFEQIHILDEDGEIETRLAPGIRVDLTDFEADINYWQDLLIPNEDNEVLSNVSSFNNFFRGLIFKVEAIAPDNDGSMQMLNLLNSNANITVAYKYDDPDEDDASITLDGAYSFSFTGIKANHFENLDFNITDGDATNGDSNLYLKGLDGSMSIINLFNGDVEDEFGDNVNALEYFKSKKDKWLINEANLTFYVDQNLTIDNEPERVVLYDLKNNLPIIDYYFDGTDNFINPVNSKVIYSDRLTRDDNNKGVKYKIRLTEHLNNILLNDSTNVNLGLFVSTNVNNVLVSKISNTTNQDILQSVPRTSILSPEGTILHGSNTNVQEDLRAKFEIYYTETEN
ncbi:DUF4270 domain-containing protein [Mesoflavibacter profundi]|uniref:DUF4270 domain-containing protein n=1 Tax=Mesoflavibacter profundi TaxID=2708110 RepID=A0ABT4S221_9FLAO|nr:DUF4270 domain-containing protein [Mesoflavibacter profundi]MDA0178124.1 DUF4270 domain-containing protein [Mesoflavibacter profundi]